LIPNSPVAPDRLLIDDVIAGWPDAAKASGEMRAIEDRPGPSPKALRQLRWRIVGDAEAGPAPIMPIDERSRQLRVLGREPSLAG
jgi:hypothetical protein